VSATYQNQKTDKVSRGAIGRWGETVAARYLEAHGFHVIARSVRYRDGELDIVAVTGGTLYFVEVKTRTGEGYGAIESVAGGKRHRFIRAARRFCSERGLTDASCQFDCVVVLGRPGEATARIRHYRNCFI